MIAGLINSTMQLVVDPLVQQVLSGANPTLTQSAIDDGSRDGGHATIRQQSAHASTNVTCNGMSDVNQVDNGPLGLQGTWNLVFEKQCRSGLTGIHVT